MTVGRFYRTQLLYIHNLASKEYAVSRNILPYTWWLAFLFGMLGACALTTMEEPPLQLRLATWPGYAPLYAVEKYNLAAPTSLEISTSELAQDNYRAFAENRVDVLATTLYSAIQFQEQGTDTVIILITDYSNGADGIIARSGIESVYDLKGQCVGVESGSIGYFVLRRALEHAGLSEADVEIKHIRVPQAITAIENGEIDAAVVWEPTLLRYEQMYGREPIFTSAAIPNEIVDVLVVRPEVLEQRTDDLVNLARGWDSAVQRWRAGDPDVLQAMAAGLNVEESALPRQFMGLGLVDLEHNSRLLDLSGPADIQPVFETMIHTLQATDQIEGTAPTPAEMLHAEIVQAALRAEAP
jgi:NitT/TauT family transport system substrate-binding protein